MCNRNNCNGVVLRLVDNLVRKTVKSVTTRAAVGLGPTHRSIFDLCDGGINFVEKLGAQPRMRVFVILDRGKQFLCRVPLVPMNHFFTNARACRMTSSPSSNVSPASISFILRWS